MATSHLATWGPDSSRTAPLPTELKICALRQRVSRPPCERMSLPHGHAESQHSTNQSTAILPTPGLFATRTPSHSPPIESAKAAAAGWMGERAKTTSIALGGIEPLTAFDSVTAIDIWPLRPGWRGMVWSNAEAKSKGEHSH
jgi:hypothetical protein